LNTIFNHLDIKDNFDIHLVCPVCHHIYPHDSQGDAKCLNCSEPLFEPSTSRTKPRPCLQCPQNPLSNAILHLLSCTGIEEELDAWRCHVPEPGKRALIQDGEIWRTIKGNDGELFFDNSPECPNKDKLRIGITLGFDGFGYQCSCNAGTHSLGVLSNCIANLPTHLQYVLATVNVCFLTLNTWPKEFDSDELQFFMKNYIDNLISLYENRIMVKTPNYPSGMSSICMILVAVCCDHPALCKVCGFGGHRKEEGFCTLLGIICCHWYDSWIQTNTIRKQTDKKKHELDQIHDYLMMVCDQFIQAFFSSACLTNLKCPTGLDVYLNKWAILLEVC
ncbi:uncharacterized protein BJ212DRAFT_1270478, partial [Suillus subaureus]